MLSHWRQRERQKTLQIQGLRLGPARFPPTCRPIHFEETETAEMILRRRRRRVEDARRNEIDNLPENGVYCLRCFWWGCFHKLGG